MRKWGAVIVAAWFLCACSSSLSTSARQQRAYDACKRSAEAQLSAPTTATWPAISKTTDAIVTLIDKDARAVIVSHVDAENSLGVPLRANVTCTFDTKDGGKTWAGKALVLPV